MKILLIYPYFLEKRLHVEDISAVPMGLYYVAAVLRHNQFDVEILNWYNLNPDPLNVKEILAQKKPDVIGFSILHANRWGAIDIARAAKQINSEVHIVLGGVGATFLWRHFLTHFPDIDFIVLGEGEYPFLNLVKTLQATNLEQLEKINGIAFRKSGRIYKTDRAEAICDLDELPNPAQYFNYRHLAMTRGCVWKCSFCGSPQFWGGRVRFHSAPYFVRQIELLYQKGITFFYVSDDTFTIDKQRVIEACKRIIQKKINITWAAVSRVDCVDEEILYWMRSAGCIQISYGVESGSKKIRDLLKKNIHDEQIKAAFALTQSYGIMARAYFIYGCPEESWETIQETIDLMNAIKPLSVIFYILDIFPGTQLYEAYRKKAKVSDDIWLERMEDIMYFETDPALDQDQILAFGKKLRASFYENLPTYVEAIRLVDKRELHPLHSDFYSRLAMTFDHGDYADIDAVRGKRRLAEKLYMKSLDYFPNARAYLGLGILLQKKSDYQGSIDLLCQALEHFPHDPQLNICLGVSHMNLGQYQKALPYFLKFENRKEAVQCAADCYSALNDVEKAARYYKILESL